MNTLSNSTNLILFTSLLVLMLPIAVQEFLLELKYKGKRDVNHHEK
jgi:hypothetical protein